MRLDDLYYRYNNYSVSDNFNSIENMKTSFLDRIKSLRYDNSLPAINQLSS